MKKLLLGPSGLFWGVAASLFVITAIVFAPATANEFINYDDDVYVVENPHIHSGLTGSGVAWAFGLHGYAANWHPLTWMSHMLDVDLFGLEPGGPHLVNVLLHAANAALLFAALCVLTRNLVPSACVAALFALHPLRVESVAWIAERKDVLSGLFWMLSLLAYGWYCRQPERRRMALVATAFALGLLAKPMLVTLPFVLLLLDGWPLRRELSFRERLVEKVPLFLLSAVASLLTFLAQRKGGALGPLDSLSFVDRLANAFVAYADYALTTFWPSGLAVLYPHPAILATEGLQSWGLTALGGVLLVTGGTLLAWMTYRTRPFVLTGWFWFLGTLVPVIGLVQVGVQARADRYTYLPSIGLAIAVVWLVWGLVVAKPILRRPIAMLAAIVLLLLAFTTFRLTRTWRSSLTLFQHAIAVTEENYLAHTNLGEAFLARNNLEDAATHFLEALRIRPGLAPVHGNLGVARVRQGRLEDGIAELERSVELAPEFAQGHGNLGSVLQGRGEDSRAVYHLQRCLELEPGDLEVMNTLAWVLASSRDDSVRNGPESLRLAERVATGTGYANPRVLESLAAAYAETGDFEKAVRWQREALKRVPPSARRLLQSRLHLYEARQPFRKTP